MCVYFVNLQNMSYRKTPENCSNSSCRRQKILNFSCANFPSFFIIFDDSESIFYADFMAYQSMTQEEYP